MSGNIFIGTSGWSYNHWEGVLYPPGYPAKDRLDVYLQHYNTVELNSSFYHWPRDTAFSSWETRLPEGFRMSVKAPRDLTHVRRLTNPETWLEIMPRGLKTLGSKLGLLLVQLPPTLPRDEPLLEAFLEKLPGWIACAVEFRHPSWHVEAVFEALARHRAAYCVMSGVNLPCIRRVTSLHAYMRLHGTSSDGLYTGSYSEEELAGWVETLNGWCGQGYTCWVYFNNDIGGHAVRNVRRLIEMLKE